MYKKCRQPKPKNKADLRGHFIKRFKQRLGVTIEPKDVDLINKLVQTHKWIDAARQSITRLLVLLQSNELPYKEKFLCIYNKKLKSVVTCFSADIHSITYNDNEFIVNPEVSEDKKEIIDDND